MAVSYIISFGQRPELHTLITYLLGAGTTGPRVELKGLEFRRKNIPLRGYDQVPRLVARSWPVTQGQPFALHELAE